MIKEEPGCEGRQDNFLEKVMYKLSFKPIVGVCKRKKGRWRVHSR